MGALRSSPQSTLQQQRRASSLGEPCVRTLLPFLVLDAIPWTVNTLIMKHSKILTGAEFELIKPSTDCDPPKKEGLPDGSNILRHSEVSTGANFEMARSRTVETARRQLRIDFIKNAEGADSELLAKPVNPARQSREIPPSERFLLARPNQNSTSTKEPTSKKERSL